MGGIVDAIRQLGLKLRRRNSHNESSWLILPTKADGELVNLHLALSRQSPVHPLIAELEQIQLLLGRASLQTTERYLGTKQDLVRPTMGPSYESRSDSGAACRLLLAELYR